MKNQPELICTLTDDDAATQVIGWQELQTHVTQRRRIERGVVLTVPAGMNDAVEDLVRLEAQCCGFLALTTARRDDLLDLTITSDHAGAAPMIEKLAGFRT